VRHWPPPARAPAIRVADGRLQVQVRSGAYAQPLAGHAWLAAALPRREGVADPFTTTDGRFQTPSLRWSSAAEGDDSGWHGFRGAGQRRGPLFGQRAGPGGREAMTGRRQFPDLLDGLGQRSGSVGGRPGSGSTPFAFNAGI